MARSTRRQRHDLTSLRTIGVRILLGGGETFHDREVFGRAKEEWFHPFLSLPHGLPSHDTFHRVCAALEPAQFTATFQTWTQTLRQARPGERVALQGHHRMLHAEVQTFLDDAVAERDGPRALWGVENPLHWTSPARRTGEFTCVCPALS